MFVSNNASFRGYFVAKFPRTGNSKKLIFAQFSFTLHKEIEILKAEKTSSISINAVLKRLFPFYDRLNETFPNSNFKSRRLFFISIELNVKSVYNFDLIEAFNIAYCAVNLKQFLTLTVIVIVM